MPELACATEGGERYISISDMPASAHPGDVLIIRIDSTIYTVRVLYAGFVEILANHNEVVH